MTLELKEADRCIEIFSPMPRAFRVVLFLLAGFPLLAPYELLYLPQWQTYLHPVFFMFAFVALGATAMSLLLVFAAIAGLESRLRFDRKSGEVSFASRAPIVRERREVGLLRDVKNVEVRTHDWSEGSPSYSLRIAMADGREFRSGSSWSQTEVEQLKHRIDEFLATGR